MAGRSFLVLGIFIGLFASCASEQEQAEKTATTAPLVIVKPRPKTLSAAQRAELAFPDDIINQVEAAAGTNAEPFFEQIMSKSANLKGNVMITTGRLSGFSVRTRLADDVISDLAAPLRSRGFLVFRSGQNFGNVPDIVTVVRGSSSYDILEIQHTESVHYHLDTDAIIKWLRQQQTHCGFVITGAGADWVEARFVRPPRDMKAFARRIAAFAPDVLREGSFTVDKLAAWMKETNGFRLVWD